jgi:uncharacterized membrane protein
MRRRNFCAFRSVERFTPTRRPDRVTLERRMQRRVVMKRVIQIILVFGLAGLAFSGYLTYRELFAGTGTTCPSIGEPGTVFGAPPCVYGFFMYLAIVALAAIGLARAGVKSA